MKFLKLLIMVGIFSNLLFADVKVNLSGKTTLFYQTFTQTKESLFKKNISNANALFQINADFDLGNQFSAYIQGTYLSTLGLEKNLVSGTIQRTDGTLNGNAITQAYLKKVSNKTTFKFGRMNISKSISPFIFSEKWTPSNNSLDAIVIKDETIEDTTLVVAFISQGNKHNNLNSFNNIAQANDGIYLFTLKNKTINFLPLNYSYYSINNINNTKKKIQAHILSSNIISQDYSALSLGLQGGKVLNNIIQDNKDTTFYGIKLSYKMDNMSYSAAYSSVDDGTVGIVNMATGGNGNPPAKSPLYTQMLLNQGLIARDSKTFVLKAILKNILSKDKVIIQYGQSKLTNRGVSKFNEFDALYKIKLANNIDIFTGYAWLKSDSNDARHFVRLWAKYSF